MQAQKENRPSSAAVSTCSKVACAAAYSHRPGVRACAGVGMPPRRGPVQYGTVSAVIEPVPHPPLLRPTQPTHCWGFPLHSRTNPANARWHRRLNQIALSNLSSDHLRRTNEQDRWQPYLSTIGSKGCSFCECRSAWRRRRSVYRCAYEMYILMGARECVVASS